MKLERMGLLQGLGSKVKEDLCGLGPEGQQQGVCEVTPAGVVCLQAWHPGGHTAPALLACHPPHSFSGRRPFMAFCCWASLLRAFTGGIPRLTRTTE